jgi:stress responsive alpha/beta barrel protein
VARSSERQTARRDARPLANATSNRVLRRTAGDRFDEATRVVFATTLVVRAARDQARLAQPSLGTGPHVVTHLVLMKPRPDLSAPDCERLIMAFERALTEIPAVRHVRVGRRITHGAGYEAGMPDSADYLVAIEFDDVEGLAAYLRDPAHVELGARFTESLTGALVYDFEEIGLKSLRDLCN